MIVRPARRKAVKTKSCSQRAYDAIREKIYVGEYPPCMQLKEEHIAQELGISATPVREALRRLEKEYWVTIIPYNGAYVREQGLKEIIDLFDLRSVHEGLAARLCALNMNQSASNKFEAILRNEQQLIEEPEIDYEMVPPEKDWDLKFHRLMVVTANNERLKDMAITYRMQEHSIHPFYGVSNSLEAKRGFHEEHRQILRALQLGDPDMAEKLAREHIIRAKERGLAYLNANAKQKQTISVSI